LETRTWSLQPHVDISVAAQMARIMIFLIQDILIVSHRWFANGRDGVKCKG
jgi:hypothetical protein